MLTLKKNNQSGPEAMDQIEVSDKQDNQPYTQSYRGFQLESVFQPILSISHRRPVGYEGLIRGRKEKENSTCSPQTLLNLPTTQPVLSIWN